MANGQRHQPDEVAQVFGMPFDLQPAETRIRRLAAETTASRGAVTQSSPRDRTVRRSTPPLETA